MWATYTLPRLRDETIQRSSVVERSAVNRLVVGSNPTAGAIFMFWGDLRERGPRYVVFLEPHRSVWRRRRFTARRWQILLRHGMDALPKDLSRPPSERSP